MLGTRRRTSVMILHRRTERAEKWQLRMRENKIELAATTTTWGKLTCFLGNAPVCNVSELLSK